MAQWGARRPRSTSGGGGRVEHARDAKVVTLVDDYEDRKTGAVGLTRDQRVSLEFKPFDSQTYLHLRNRRMAVLSKAVIHGAGLGSVGNVASRSYSEDDWEDYDPETEKAYNEYGDSESSGGESPRRAGARRPREPELYDAIRHPLSEALDAVREMLERRALMAGRGGGGGAEGGGRAQGGVERVKLLVRLGKLLFSVQGRPDPSATLTSIPPFSAKKLEDHMNERAPFVKQVYRTYESHLPQSAYQQVEDMLLGDGQVAHSLGEKYNIQVVDTREHIVYKAVCKHSPHEQRLTVKKVKKPPVRRALFDIARPDKVVDARLILVTETHLTALDDELEVALESILEATKIDPQSPAGLRIPAHMTETHGSSDTTSRRYGGGGTGSRGYGGTTSRGYSGGVASGRSAGAGSSSRFVVRAVRHATTRRAEGRGRVWKLSRVDGVEFKEGGGRRTNEIEFCPVAWQQELKGGPDGHPSPRGQQPPTWTTEEIMAECPGLLSWLSKNLP
ncbi:unnamed protein product [Closterium sp. Naga37s-1]|nr:unnamed protein product [Closterium sp. Naga37s-1]CAI5537638.1 unnamed protein product [Closterium sp. Naga37s-1]